MLFHATESQATAIFKIVWILLLLATTIVSSARTAITTHSMRSILQANAKPRYEIDRSRLPYYLEVICLATVLSILFILTFDTNLRDVAIGTLVNTLVIAWGCFYLIFCKNRPNSSSR